MALPRRGDPQRPLHLAIRYMRVVAAIYLLFGCFVIAVLLAGFFPALERVRLLLVAVAAVGYLGPGITYAVLGVFLKRRRFWAVMTSLIVVSLNALLLVGGIGNIIVQNWRGEEVSIIGYGLAGLFLLALLHMVYLLSRSFQAIRYAMPEQHGFQPIMPAGKSTDVPPSVV
jgi:hypothetical protein